MVRMTKKTLQCSQTLSLLRIGSGNETIHIHAARGVCALESYSYCATVDYGLILFPYIKTSYVKLEYTVRYVAMLILQI